MNTESANMYGLLKVAAGSTGPIPGPPGAPAAPATSYEPPSHEYEDRYTTAGSVGSNASMSPVQHLGRRLGAQNEAKQYAQANQDRRDIAGKIADTRAAAATPEGRDFLQQLQSQNSSDVPSVWYNNKNMAFGASPVYMKGVTQPGDTQRRQPAKLPFEEPVDYKLNAITSPRQDIREDWVQAPQVAGGPLNLSYRMNEAMSNRLRGSLVPPAAEHTAPRSLFGRVGNRVVRGFKNMGHQLGL